MHAEREEREQRTRSRGAAEAVLRGTGKEGAGGVTLTGGLGQIREGLQGQAKEFRGRL